MHQLLAVIAPLVLLAMSSDDVRVAREAVVALRSGGGEVVEGDFVVVLAAARYAELRGDSDLGPFIDSATKHEDEVVVVVVPGSDGPSRAVFFADGQARAWSTVPGGAPVERRGALAAANRKPVFLPSPHPSWPGCFLDNTVTTDDGKELPAVEAVFCR